MQIPLHPLAVHLPVVLIPLVAIGVIVWALWPGLARQIKTLIVGVCAVAVAATFWAKETGEELLKLEGLDEHNPGPAANHLWWADTTMIAVALLFVVIAALWFFNRKTTNNAIVIVLKIAAVILAIAAVFVTFKTGHAGALLVWQE